MSCSSALFTRREASHHTRDFTKTERQNVGRKRTPVPREGGGGTTHLFPDDASVRLPQHRISDADDLYRRLPRGDASHLPHDDVADLDDLVGRPSLLRLGHLRKRRREGERERARAKRTRWRDTETLIGCLICFLYSARQAFDETANCSCTGTAVSHSSRSIGEEARCELDPQTSSQTYFSVKSFSAACAARKISSTMRWFSFSFDVWVCDVWSVGSMFHFGIHTCLYMSYIRAPKSSTLRYLKPVTFETRFPGNRQYFSCNGAIAPLACRVLDLPFVCDKHSVPLTSGTDSACSFTNILVQKMPSSSPPDRSSFGMVFKSVLYLQSKPNRFCVEHAGHTHSISVILLRRTGFVAKVPG